MMRIKQQIISYFSALLMIPAVAFAETITLGGATELYPYTFKKGDQIIGIDADIGRKIFERLGIELEIKTYPWKRLERYLNNGKLDGILGIFDFDYEETFADSLDRVQECMYVSKVAIYARKDRKLSISSPADLDGKSVGTQGGYLYTDELEQVKWSERVEAVRQKNLIQRLEKGRIDVVISEDKPFWFYSRQLGYQDEFEEIYNVRETLICMGLSRKALGSRVKVLSHQVSDIVKQLKSEGVIQSILDKYK